MELFVTILIVNRSNGKIIINIYFMLTTITSGIYAEACRSPLIAFIIRDIDIQYSLIDQMRVLDLNQGLNGNDEWWGCGTALRFDSNYHHYAQRGAKLTLIEDHRLTMPVTFLSHKPSHKQLFQISPGIEVLCYNESVKVHRAFAYLSFITEEEAPEHGGLIECKSLFSGRNITTDFEDMWCTSFASGTKFCHIVMELREPAEITS